jgi:hypothetical protein
VEIALWRILERQKLRCYNWIMKMDPCSLASLTDEQLLLNVKALAARERESTVQLIASLAELDVRRLYLGEGFPSLFAYCTQVLHLSEHAAYGRIEAVRAVHRFPMVLDAAGQCAERGFLELHHVVPFAEGGEATTGNIELRCRAHNAYEAVLSFGSFVLRERQPEYNSVRTEFSLGTPFVP